MRYNVRLYFNQPVSEQDVQSLLNSEFEMDEAEILKVDADSQGIMYALLSVSDDIPVEYLKTIGDRRLKVTSAVREETGMEKKNVIELPEDVEINGEKIKAGTKIEVMEEKQNLKESHSMEIASDLSKVRFDTEDASDVMYIAEDIFTGIINGVGESRYISDSIKDEVLGQIAYMFDDYQ